MSVSLSAVSASAPPLVTVESAIRDAIVFTMTLAPMIAEIEVVPDPATLTPMERISD